MRLLHPKQGIKEKSVVTIGTFDGVHLGHRKVFDKVIDISRRRELASVVITLEPPPKRFFSMGEIENLTTLSEKTEILSDIGIDYLLVLPFNRELINTESKDFVKKVLIDLLCAEYLVIGYDFRMGKNQDGTQESLLNLPLYVNVISPYIKENEPVKSSTIRSYVSEGLIHKANAFLGYNYRISGNIVKGLGIANGLGFPTVNIQPSPEKLLPSDGVYAVKLFGRKKFGMLYIGTRPTFDINKKTVEIHFIDSVNLSNVKTLTVEIIKKIRDEEKFRSKNDLIEQLVVDKNETIALFKEENFDL